MKQRVAIIGSGFSGITAACYAAAEGYDVTLLEKNTSLGGRARQMIIEEYRFDMGPSWYWMPDVFERFFADFGKRVDDYYRLQLLDPGFRIFYKRDHLDVPADQNALIALFEEMEPGAGEKLVIFMKDAKYKYQVGMQDLVYKPGLKWSEFLDGRLLSAIFKLDLMTPFDKFVKRHFKDIRLRQLMEFPVLFLGASPAQTPALYSLMNYAGLILGTWYPTGGMHVIVESMTKLARELGVRIKTNAHCQRINIKNKKAHSITVDGDDIHFDFVISSADYHHTEQVLLRPEFRNYSANYWENRTMAPSSLIFYLGIKGKVQNLLHHNLFFDEDLDTHTAQIYDDPRWPGKPLFYVCCPSKTDSTVAPDGCENLFVLMPLAAGLTDTTELRDKYFDMILNRLEQKTGEDIKTRIEVKRSYCIEDFIADYHAFKGNAYGLANTLRQTALLKPKLINKKVKNLFYTGHLTVPGPGVPPSIISGKLVVEQLKKA